MKICLAQLNTQLGSVEKNTQKIKDVISTHGKDVDVIAFSEMTITGYPLNDMLDDDDLVKKQKEVIYEIKQLVAETNKNLKVILGFIDYNPDEKLPSGEMKKYNAAAVIGEDIQIYHKRLLPNYDVFFEMRYFAPGTEGLTFAIREDLKGAMTICEDIWDDDYAVKPIKAYKDQNVDVVFNISSSPFTKEKLKTRFNLLNRHAQDIGAHMVYVNQVGGQDELVFDGASMVVGPEGTLQHMSKRFEEDVTIFDTEEKHTDKTQEVLDEYKNNYYHMLEAIKLCLKDYMAKTGLKDVVIGVSGGIDSALDLYILSQVVPVEHIHAIYMPTQYNSDESLSLSQKLCDNAGVKLQVGAIEELVKSFEKFGVEKLGKKPEGVSHENIQARIRAIILMNIANDVRGLVINNTNKTEYAMGYGTLYGDLIGGISLIGDLIKTEVYGMAKFVNDQHGYDIIPSRIIDRKASAELAPGQFDPFNYERESAAIEELQFGKSLPEVAKKYNLSLDEVKEMRRKIKINEFKIKQGTVVVKLKKKSVGVGRLYPVVE